ncbi:MAG: hypothetical protein IKU07_09560 [Oscillospiraceae bacterium]|nr:hypothetical protein [Oscillospiraceae bacterium]
MKRILSLICVLAMVLGMITVPAFATEAETLQEKVDSYTSGTITLTENAEKLVVNANTYIDLNGYSIDGISVADGATVYVSDSQTDDYTVADGVYGAITGITGAVEAAQGYVAVEENNTVSFHRVDLAIKSMSLRPGVAGVYYTSSFAADEVVSAKVESYGVALSVVEAPNAENLDVHCGYSVLYDFGAGQKSGTLLTDIMTQANNDATNARNAAMEVYGRAYIKTADGYAFGAVAVRSLQQQVEAIDAILGNLNATQKAGIAAFYNTYKAAMENWNIPNLRGEQLGDIVIAVPVESENGVVTETVTIEQDGMSITVPFGTLLAAGATELTLNVTKKAQSDSGIEAAAGETLMPFDVHVEGVSSENTVPLTVALGKVMPENLNMGNYSIYHVEKGETKEMTLVSGDEEFTAHNQFKYTLDGELTLHMATFSEVAALTNDTNVWNGGIATSFGGGTGAEADPYLIRNADQLAYLNVLVSADDQAYVEASYKLLSDIDFGGEENSHVWYPIGYWHRGEGKNSAGEDTWYTYGGAFMGTFDGNGHKVSNIYQNTWIMDGNYDYGYWDEAMGLFGYVYEGTIKNLTVENFSSDGEFTPTGCVTAYATDSTFENISLVSCNPRVYNTGNGGIVGIGGLTTDTEEDKLTFNNITIDNSNKITALWGSWDVACGGLVGMFRGAGQVYMNNCHVAAQIDVYNDVCGNYQYYWYRYAGMLIGTNKNMITDENGYTVPETSKFHATNCTVHFGDWNNYYYCELVANSLASYTHDHQFSRLTEIKSLDEIKTGDTWTKTGNFVLFTDRTRDVETATCFHIVKAEDGSFKRHMHEDEGTEIVNGEPVLKEDKQIVYLPFNQLFTGYGWGVKHIPVYNGEDYAFEGVTILDRLPQSNVKFENILNNTLAQNKENLVIAENTVLTAGQLFAEAENVDDIQRGNVQIFVSPADENSTVEPVSVVCDENWTAESIRFKGRGKATVTITDYYFCTPTVINLTVGSINDAAEAMVFEGEENVDALCPVCAAVVTWNPLDSQYFTVKEVTTGNRHEHYYASAERTYSNSSWYMVSELSNGSNKVAMCLNLNDQTLTSTVRALVVDGGRATLNIMGNGTVIGAGTDPSTSTGTVPSRGAVDSTGMLNLYGGTYRSSSNVQPVLSLRGSGENAITNMYEDVTIDRTETKGLGVFLYENHKLNMYGGTIIGGDSTDVEFTNSKGAVKTVNGGNLWIYAFSSDADYSVEFNMYGGTVTGGKDTNGGNIYLYGNNKNNASVVNIQGGMITDGEIYVTGKSAVVSLSGAPQVDQLRLNDGKQLTVGQLSETARVNIAAMTTDASKEDADKIIASGLALENEALYETVFKATRSDLTVRMDKEGDDYVLKLAEICPHCNDTVEWIELTDSNLKNYRIKTVIDEETTRYQMTGGHYKLSENVDYETQIYVGLATDEVSTEVIMDLNGYSFGSTTGRCMLLTSKSAAKAFVMDSTPDENGVMYGTYTTGSGVIYLYSGTEFNFYSGNIDSYGTPHVAGTIYGNGGTFNMYGGTLKAPDTTYGLGGVIYAKSSSKINILGGYVEGGNAVSYDTNSGQGGAIYATGSGTVVTIENATIGAGTAEHSGGTIYVTASAEVNIENASIGAGTTNYGGTFYVNNATLNIKESVIAGGRATEYGGMFYTRTSAKVTVEDSQLGVATSASGGGVFYGLSSSEMNIINCTLEASSSDGSGGVLRCTNSTLNLTGTTIKGGSTEKSGGILYAEGATVTITDNVIKGGTATGSGGVLYVGVYESGTTKLASTLNVTGTTFEGGTSGASGGIMYISASEVNIDDCTFAGGTAKNYGATVYAAQSVMNINDSSFAKGTSGSSGTIWFTQAGGKLNLTGSTSVNGRLRFYETAEEITVSNTVQLEDLYLSNVSAEKVKLGALEAGASITVRGMDGAFTAANENAADYLQYFNLHSTLADTKEIVVIDNQLVVQDKTTEPAEPEATEPQA